MNQGIRALAFLAVTSIIVALGACAKAPPIVEEQVEETAPSPFIIEARTYVPHVDQHLARVQDKDTGVVCYLTDGRYSGAMWCYNSSNNPSN